MDVVQAQAFEHLDRRLDGPRHAPIALGLSGGGDSLALLHLATDWASQRQRRILALTVDHGLSPQSAAWTRSAAQMAQQAGAEWRGLIWEGAKPATGLPAAARRARHRLLAEAAREAGANVLLLGHTEDDVKESALMRASTATLGHLREWSPSPVWPEGRDVFLLRPLLSVSRAELRRWLTAQGLEWLDDPANSDPRFARSRARKLLAEDSQVDAPPDLSIAVVPKLTPSGGLTVGRGWFQTLRLEARISLLARLLVCASGQERPPSAAAVLRLDAALQTQGQVATTLAGALLTASADAVTAVREAGRRGLPSVELEPGREAIWDGRIALRAIQSGWSVRAAGSLGITRSPSQATAVEWSVMPAMVSPDGTVLVGDAMREVANLRPLALRRFLAACHLIETEGDVAAPVSPSVPAD